MPKSYILDTNVLLHNPNALFSFKNNNVIIPFAVIEEIDNQKRRQDEIGRNARVFSQTLDGLRANGQLSRGISLSNGGRLLVEMNHQENIPFPKGLNPEKFDNRILALACNMCKESAEPVILVTKDLNLRIKADVLGITSEDFSSDKVDFSELYRGVSEIHVSADQLDAYYHKNGLGWTREPVPYPNEFIVLRNSMNPSQSALSRFYEGKMRPLSSEGGSCWGIKARNKEQKFALEILMDDAVKIVTIVGRAGTGKTLIALAAGMEKVINKKEYTRLLVIRPVIPMGDDLGYLPGTKEEKLRPWMQPIYDNLEYLFHGCSDSDHLLDEFMNRGMIQLETLTYIRGRSIPNQFIICDESQNLSPNMIKTLITRVGEGTKIVFTGDPEQIDHPYLDASSNGLSYLVEKLKGETLSGHISLIKGERSPVAELGARLL